MSRQFSGYDISSFIDSGISYYLNDIEGNVIEMAKESDPDERYKMQNEIQGLIENIMEFIR